MANKKQLSLPATFQEHRRNYILDIAPEGRMSSSSSSAESCLQTMTHISDGTIYSIEARYKEHKIGYGRYRKRGPSGRIETVEVIEAEGAMIGLIEAALAKREETRQVAEQQTRASRLLPLPCPSCGHALGYDPIDQRFAASGGEVISTCEYCGEILSLEHFEQHYTQRIRQLQADLHHAEEARKQVLALKTKREQKQVL